MTLQFQTTEENIEEHHLQYLLVFFPLLVTNHWFAVFIPSSLIMSVVQLFWGDVTCNLYFQLCTFSMSLQAVIQEPLLSFGKKNTSTAGPKAVPSAMCQFLPPRWKESALKSPSKLLFTHSECSGEDPLHSHTTGRGLICWRYRTLAFIKGSCPGFFAGSCIAGGSRDMQQGNTCLWLLVDLRERAKQAHICWLEVCRHAPGAQTAELFHVASPSPPAHTETVE